MMEDAIIKPCPKCGGDLECPDGWIFNKNRIVGTADEKPNCIFLRCKSCDFETPAFATINEDHAIIISRLLIRYWNENKGEGNKELLPCPLCAGKGLYEVEQCLDIERIKCSNGRYGKYHSHDFFKHYVWCKQCTYSTPDIIAASEDGGIYSILARFSWNYRPTNTPNGGVSWL